MWKYASLRSIVTTNPPIGSETQSSWLSTFWTCKIWGSGSIREDLKLDATPHPSWEPENTGCNSLTLCLAGEHVLWPLCPAELATLVSTNALVPVSRKWRPRRWNAEADMQTESCSLSLQSFLPTEIYLAVASTLPASLKGALVSTLCFDGGMLDVRCPETWQEATEHVTFRWRPLLPETPVATETEQRPPEGARKESLFSVGIFHAPPRGGAHPRGPGRASLRTFSGGDDAPQVRSLWGGLWSAASRTPVSTRGCSARHTLLLCFTPQRNRSWSGPGGRRSRLLSTAGKKPHKRLLIALCLPKPSGDGVNGVAK